MVKVISNTKGKYPVYHVINIQTGYSYGNFTSLQGAENKAEQVNANLTLEGLLIEV